VTARAARWTPADLVALGYFAIRPRRAPPDFAARPYFVCSPASCLVDEPLDWIVQWRHNAVWLFDTLDVLEEMLPADGRAGWLRLALRGLPEQIGVHRDGWPLEWKAREVRPAAIPGGFVRLGYDVCSRYAQSSLECSPLSCNGYADELGANRFCLFESFDAALAAAERFAA
jgi:hypothetical protein